jgi:hypothetical protein
MTREAFVAGLFCAAFFLLVGVTALLWPEKIQLYALKHSAKFSPYLGWMKTRQYIWSLRLIGLISTASAALLIWILIQAVRLGRVT